MTVQYENFFLIKTYKLLEAIMDKNKVDELAKSFSQSCKQVIKSKSLVQEITSPAVMLISLTVLNILVNDSGITKRPGWAMI
jgi:hypothetical protein